MSSFLQPPNFQPVAAQQGTSPLVSELMKLMGGTQVSGAPSNKMMGNPVAALNGNNGTQDFSELMKKIMQLWSQGAFGASTGMPGTPLFGHDVASGSPTDPTAE